MRIERCQVAYLGELADLYAETPNGVVIGTHSDPMNISIYRRDNGKRRIVDTIWGAKVEDQKGGVKVISGTSDRARAEFGKDDAEVRIRVTPYGNCVGCGK